MKQEKQEARRREIRAAAYEVLAEKGYKATSMLAIAKRASASNETLYSWYGNKQTLFRSLVEENAREVADLLRRNIDANADPRETIESLGPLLLRLVTGDKAIALNRAAVADAQETGILGETLAAAGRDTVAPLISAVFEQARKNGMMRFDDTKDAVDIYIGLLIGDLQIRRAIGVHGPLDDAELKDRADRAFRLITDLFGTDRRNAP